MKTNISEKIEIPEKIEVKVDKGIVNVKGPKGEVNRNLLLPKIKISVKDNAILIESKNATKREKKMIGTFKAHIRNLIKGAAEGFVYKLKICSSHFPMTASIENNQFVVKNFLGENTPRTLGIKEGVNIKIEGNDVVVESINKELAGQTAASIEKLCKIKGRDTRIFQDGIWMTEKAGKEIK
ncbi:50S ribosomal protein L6 [Candidatus Woesearchaeota archaeon]|nr:50S ribosomal protein L6 [Candidatus Woesearchaeota archaeon]